MIRLWELVIGFEHKNIDGQVEISAIFQSYVEISKQWLAQYHVKKWRQISNPMAQSIQNYVVTEVK